MNRAQVPGRDQRARKARRNSVRTRKDLSPTPARSGSGGVWPPRSRAARREGHGVEIWEYAPQQA